MIKKYDKLILAGVERNVNNGSFRNLAGDIYDADAITSYGSENQEKRIVIQKAKEILKKYKQDI